MCGAPDNVMRPTPPHRVFVVTVWGGRRPVFVVGVAVMSTSTQPSSAGRDA